MQGKEAQRSSLESTLRREEAARGEVERAMRSAAGELDDLRTELSGAVMLNKTLRDRCSAAENEVKTVSISVSVGGGRGWVGGGVRGCVDSRGAQT